MINKKYFFDSIRPIFGGKLDHDQVDGINAILEYWENNLDDRPIQWLAYALATVYHECARKMFPITEYGKATYFNKYSYNTVIGKRLGNTQSGDGYKYRGRGFVQLTGRDNYDKASKKLGIDFINNPELVLDLNNSTKILFLGMTEGWFTGKKLSDYIGYIEADYFNARRIINGIDQAKLIASYAKKFQEALNG